MGLYIRYEGDGDPEKCTVKKFERSDMAVLHGSDRETPYGVILSPHADRVLLLSDADTGALVALDRSWESAGEVMFLPPGEHRVLPYLVAANLANFGCPMQLTMVEAIATTLVIFGEKKRAGGMFSKFNWGHTFLELDEEPLHRHAAHADSTEVVEIQREYLERGEQPVAVSSNRRLRFDSVSALHPRADGPGDDTVGYGDERQHDARDEDVDAVEEVTQRPTSEFGRTPKGCREEHDDDAQGGACDEAVPCAVAERVVHEVARHEATEQARADLTDDGGRQPTRANNDDDDEADDDSFSASHAPRQITGGQELRDGPGGAGRSTAFVRVSTPTPCDPFASGRAVRRTCTASPPFGTPSPKRTRFHGSAIQRTAMIFEFLPTAPRLNELIDKTFSWAAHAERAKQSKLEAQQSMLQTMSNILSNNLRNIVIEQPDFEMADSFYYELVGAIVDIDEVRKSLSEMMWTF